MHATAASKERQLVGLVRKSSLPVTLFSPSSRLLPNNVFYPFGGLQPARLLCSLTMDREEVKLHSAQLIFPNMLLCRRLSFLLLLSSLFSSTSPFPPSLLLLGPLGDVVLPRRNCIFLSRRPSEESGNMRRAPAGSWTSKRRLFEVWRNLGSRTSGLYETHLKPCLHKHCFYWKFHLGRAEGVNTNALFLSYHSLRSPETPDL